VFNIADSSITVGVFIILFFQKRFFAELENKEEKEPVSDTISETEGTVEIKETVS
jgi:hypothetical protein